MTKRECAFCSDKIIGKCIIVGYPPWLSTLTGLYTDSEPLHFCSERCLLHWAFDKMIGER